MNNRPTDITTDLTYQLKKGDKKAFAVLVKRFSHKIYCSGKKMALNDDEASEVCQEVFVRIWEVRETLDCEKSLNGLIFTITKNIILKKIRKKAYATVLEKYWKVTHSNTTRNTEEYLDLKELEELTAEFIDRLPEKQKEIMKLRISRGLTNDEIAEKLGISKRTVENQVYRSLNKLRNYLSKQG